MSVFPNSAALQRALVLVLSLTLVTGVIAVPWLMTFSNFAVLAATVVGGVWVCMATFHNAQPASSLAQSIHDSEVVAVKRADRL
jgi:uncharacterized membrane protein